MQTYTAPATRYATWFGVYDDYRFKKVRLNYEPILYSTGHTPSTANHISKLNLLELVLMMSMFHHSSGLLSFKSLREIPEVST